MFCSNCGKNLPDVAKFCDACGAPVASPVRAPAPEPAPVRTPVPEPIKVPEPEPEHVDEPLFRPEPDPVVPEENRPLSPWAYFGYGFLFSIPVIGFILLIVFSFAGKNVNRKNFARSYWRWAILCVAIILICAVVLLTGVLRGLTETVAAWLNSIGLNWLAALIG